MSDDNNNRNRVSAAQIWALTLTLILATSQGVLLYQLAAVALPPPATPANPLIDLIKTALAPVLAFFGVIVGSCIGYLGVKRGLRTNTRNTFLDMIVGENSYRNQLDEFLIAVWGNDITSIRNAYINNKSLLILFLRKPELKARFDAAVNCNNADIKKIRDLTKRLFQE
jgi:hypothetical protein